MKLDKIKTSKTGKGEIFMRTLRRARRIIVGQYLLKTRKGS